MIVTDGCARLRLIPGKEHLLPELAVWLCSEAFKVQFRGYTTGSDGLALVSNEDLLDFIFPLNLVDGEMHEKVTRHIALLQSGEFRFSRFVSDLIDQSEKYPNPPKRKYSWAVV